MRHTTVDRKYVARERKAEDSLQSVGSLSTCRSFEHVDEASSMVTRNPAPDASPSAEPTPSKTFTVSR